MAWVQFYYFSNFRLPRFFICSQTFCVAAYSWIAFIYRVRKLSKVSQYSLWYPLISTHAGIFFVVVPTHVQKFFWVLRDAVELSRLTPLYERCVPTFNVIQALSFRIQMPGCRAGAGFRREEGGVSQSLGSHSSNVPPCAGFYCFYCRLRSFHSEHKHSSSGDQGTTRK